MPRRRPIEIQSALGQETNTGSAAAPELNNVNLHVWRVNLAQVATGWGQNQSCLSSTEQEHAARFRFTQDGVRFVQRRTVLRQVLGAYLAIPPAEIDYIWGSHGKPEATGQDGRTGLRFSCSHSGDLALIALARGREVGVDLERWRPLPDAPQLAHTFFSPEERAALASVPAAQQETAFFDCWTRKEAFIKALGLGLSFPLNRFTVSLAPNQPAALLRVEDDPDAPERWAMRSLAIAPGYSAALVADGKIASVSCLNFRPTDLIPKG